MYNNYPILTGLACSERFLDIGAVVGGTTFWMVSSKVGLLMWGLFLTVKHFFDIIFVILYIIHCKGVYFFFLIKIVLQITKSNPSKLIIPNKLNGPTLYRSCMTPPTKAHIKIPNTLKTFANPEIYLLSNYNNKYPRNSLYAYLFIKYKAAV